MVKCLTGRWKKCIWAQISSINKTKNTPPVRKVGVQKEEKYLKLLQLICGSHARPSGTLRQHAVLWLTSRSASHLSINRKGTFKFPFKRSGQEVRRTMPIGRLSYTFLIEMPLGCINVAPHVEKLPSQEFISSACPRRYQQDVAV